MNFVIVYGIHNRALRNRFLVAPVGQMTKCRFLVLLRWSHFWTRSSDNLYIQRMGLLCALLLGSQCLLLCLMQKKQRI